MFKKIITAIICAATVAGSAITADVYNINAFTITAHAAEAEMTENEIRQKIDDMAAGKYGSKFKTGNRYTYYYCGKSTVTAPPDSGSNTTYSHWQSKSCQCMGAAKNFFDVIFDNAVAYQYNYDSNSGLSRLEFLKKNLRPGDYIRYGGHSAVVYSVDANGLTLYDSNAGKPGLTNRLSFAYWEGRSTSTHYSVAFHVNNIGGKLYYIRSSKAIASENGGDNSYTAYISRAVDDNLALHSEPNFKSSSTIALMPANAEVKVFPSKNIGKYTYVVYNNIGGYCSGKYLTTIKEDDSNTDIKKGIVCGVASNSALAINSVPKKGYCIATMRNNTSCTVDISKSTDYWYYVTTNDGAYSGYSYKKYIRICD